MAQDNVENEIKLYVPFLNAVARRIEAEGGTISAPRVLEKNIRYDNAVGEFNAAGTVLRLRQDSRARLTYKDGERLLGEYGSSRTEVEVEVSDFDKMDTLLGKLGFRPTLIYEKYRPLAGCRGHARRAALRQFRRNRGRGKRHPSGDGHP